MKRSQSGWFFVAPALAAIIIFFFVPAVAAFFLSLTDFDIYALADLRNLRFVGFDNYRALLQEPLFWRSIGNTLYFVLVGTPLSLAASLGAALLVNARVTVLKPLFRTIYFAPVVTTVVAAAIVWRYLLHTRYGYINYGLHELGAPPVDWLGDPATAMPAIMLFSVWKTFGYNMVIFLAGLQSIPSELYEAARVDGASRWRQFVHVTLPGLGPSILLTGVITMAQNFQLFAEPYVMTQGGPAERTVTVLYFMFDRGFKWWSLGSASAVAFILFLFMIAFTAAQLWLSRRLEGR